MLHSSSHSSRTPSTWSMKRWRISKIKIKVLSWLSELRFWKKRQNYQSLLSYQVCTLEGQVASATKALTKVKSQKNFLSVPLTSLEKRKLRETKHFCTDSILIGTHCMLTQTWLQWEDLIDLFYTVFVSWDSQSKRSKSISLKRNQNSWNRQQLNSRRMFSLAKHWLCQHGKKEMLFSSQLPQKNVAKKCVLVSFVSLLVLNFEQH